MIEREELVIVYLGFEGTELDLGELVLEPRIGDHNSHKTSHSLASLAVGFGGFFCFFFAGVGLVNAVLLLS